MIDSKRYAPIAAELEGVAKRLGMEICEVEELIFRKVEEQYRLEDIESWYENETGRRCSEKMALAIFKEFDECEDSNVDFWTNIENAYKRVKDKRRKKQ